MWRKWKLLNVLLTLSIPPMLRQASRSHRQLARLPAESSPGPVPALSIIVPARNEALNLKRLLPTLAKMKYPGDCEVIVVDDASEDDTAAVAEAFRTRILRLDSLPAGWLGKPHACHVGAQAARGTWLLFTDADTVHHPECAARAMAYAAENKLDCLSLYLGQRTNGWLVETALLVAMAGLFARWNPSLPVLNGQYILIRRDAYADSGGFSAVRNRPIEDVAIGDHLRALGYRVRVLRGEAMAQVHMYQDARQMWQGLTRLGADSLSWSRRGAAKLIGLVTGSMVPVLALAASLTRIVQWKWSVATWTLVSSSYAVWGQGFGGLRAAILAPIGAVVVQSAACWGLVNRLLGRGISWKNRTV